MIDTTHQVIIPTSATSNQNYPNLNILPLVQDMITYGNNGFLFRLQSELISPTSMLFASMYNTNTTVLPRLEVCYHFYPLLTTSTLVNNTFCLGSPVPVPYSVSNYFNTGNVFTAQLSDSSGSFSNPVDIGSLSGTLSGIINVMIPSNTLSGTHYRIRVVGSSPPIIGSDNGVDITITNNISVAPNIYLNGPITFCIGDSLIMNSSPANYYLWSTGETTQSITVFSSSLYSLTVTDNNGCTGIASQVVNVIPYPAQPGAINGIINFCIGNLTPLIYAITPVPYATSYIWTLPTGWAGSSDSTSITVTTGVSNGIITVIAVNGCGSSIPETLSVVATICNCNTLIPSQTGLVNSDYPTTNYFHHPDFIALAWSSAVFRSLIQFDFSVIPSNAAIDSSFLSLFWHPSGSGNAGHSGTNASYLQRVTSLWASNSVSWNNQPTISTTNEVSLSTSTLSNQNYPNINVLPLIQDMMSFGNNGILLRLQSETSAKSMLFASLYNSDSTKLPKLKVCYHQIPGTATNILSSNSYCQGNSIQIPFTVFFTFNAGNIFTAQLSDMNGSFTNPINIGTISSTTSGIINAIIPSNMVYGIHYRIRVVGSNPNNIGIDNGSDIIINSNPVPIITISGPVNFCIGDSVTLTSSVETLYLWNIAATTQSITIFNTNQYYVTVTDFNGCTGSSSLTITVNNTLPSQPGLISGPSTVCSGSTLTYSIAPVANAISYQWTLPSGWTGSSNSTFITTTIGSNGGIISVVAINACGNSIPETLNVIVTLCNCSTLSPMQTGLVNSAAPTTNYYHHPDFLALDWNGTIFRSLIKFDFSAIPGNTIIDSSLLFLSWHTSGSGNPGHVGTNASYLQRVTSWWNTNSVEWNTQPTISTTNQVSLPTSSSANQSYPNLNILPLVQDMIAFGSYGILFRLQNEVPSNSMLFASLYNTDATKIPKLKVCYHTIPGIGIPNLSSNSYCQGASIAVPFIAFSTFNTGNIFTAQLSDSAGSFVTPINIGTLNSTVSGTINALIPLNTISGNHYRIRIVSSNPVIISTTNLNDITIGISNIPVITASGPTTFCPNDSVVLTSNSQVSYAWSNGSTTQSITVYTPNTYILTVTNPNGCTATASQTVSYNPSLNPTITGTTAICFGDSTTLTTGVFAHYLWNTADTTASILVDTSGIYSVTVTNASGCTGAANHSVVVNPNPIPAINSNAPSPLCNGDSAILDAATFNHYHWSSGSTSHSIVVYSSGIYSVTVTNSFGCTASTVDTITILPHVPPTISVSGPTVFCIGDSVSITSSTAAAYLWSNSLSSQSITVFSTGNYTVTVTDSNGCTGTGVQDITVNLHAPNAPDMIYGDTVLCAGTLVTYYINPVPNATNYTWILPNGWQGSPNANTISVIPDSIGGYILVTADNPCGSSPADTLFITVNRCYCTSFHPSQGGVISQNAPGNSYPNHPDFVAIHWSANCLRSLLQFNLSAIAANTVIDSAHLSLSWHLSPSGNQGHTMYNASTLQRIIAPWTPNSVTWINQPAKDTTHQVMLPNSAYNTQSYPYIDVLNITKDMLNFGNHGMIFSLLNEAGNRSMLFASGYNTDSTKTPKLSVCYHLLPILSAVHLEQNSYCTGTSFLFYFSSSFACNNNNVFTAELSDSAGGFAANTTIIGTLAAVNATVMTVTIPFNTLPGTHYRIRIRSSNPAVIGTDNGADISIRSMPLVTLSPHDTTVCITSPPFLLQGGLPVNGIFIGNNVNNGIFNPQNAGVGSFPITYLYTAPDGCSDTAMMTLNVAACTGISEENNSLAATIVPNPNDGNFYLMNLNPNSRFIIQDVLGRIVFSKLLTGTSGKTLLNVSHLSQGIYYWQLIAEDSNRSRAAINGKLAIIK